MIGLDRGVRPNLDREIAFGYAFADMIGTGLPASTVMHKFTIEHP